MLYARNLRKRGRQPQSEASGPIFPILSLLLPCWSPALCSLVLLLAASCSAFSLETGSIKGLIGKYKKVDWGEALWDVFMRVFGYFYMEEMNF